MLIITRKRGQVIRIQPNANTDPATPIGEVFAQGAIEVMVTQVRGGQVRLGLTAPHSMSILREELTVAPSLP